MYTLYINFVKASLFSYKRLSKQNIHPYPYSYQPPLVTPPSFPPHPPSGLIFSRCFSGSTEAYHFVPQLEATGGPNLDLFLPSKGCPIYWMVRGAKNHNFLRGVKSAPQLEDAGWYTVLFLFNVDFLYDQVFRHPQVTFHGKTAALSKKGMQTHGFVQIRVGDPNQALWIGCGLAPVHQTTLLPTLCSDPLNRENGHPNSENECENRYSFCTAQIGFDTFL